MAAKKFLVDLITPGIVTASRFVSNIPTGTAPFTVSSTTLVANLNADLLDGMNTSSTNAPSTVVVRDGAGNFTTNIITAVTQFQGNLVGTADYAVYSKVSDTRSTTTTPETLGS